jgi:hypothetical protein
LGPCVSPDHISFLILKIPGNDYDYIALSDPDSFLHFARDTGHSGYAVDTSYLYAVGSEQAFYMTKYLSILFAGETNSSYYSSFFLPSTTSIKQLITSNYNYGLPINGIFGPYDMLIETYLFCLE